MSRLQAALLVAATCALADAFCSYPQWSIPTVGTRTRCDHADCPLRIINDANCSDNIYGVFAGTVCRVECADMRASLVSSFTCKLHDNSSYAVGEWTLSGPLLNCSVSPPPPLPPPTCTSDDDCEGIQGCCNWDNSLAAHTVGVCGEVCLLGSFAPTESPPPTCTSDDDCEGIQGCCNWDNSLAAHTDGVCGDVCLLGSFAPTDGGKGPEECPATIPQAGTSCQVPATSSCDYGLICCETSGSCSNTTFATCDQRSGWVVVAVASVACPPAEPLPPPSLPLASLYPPPSHTEQTCPQTTPQAGTSCQVPATSSCDYGLICCETSGSCSNTTFATCDQRSGWVVVAVASVACPPAEPLPPPSPCSDEADCATGLSCCNWDNALAKAATGVCAEICALGTRPGGPQKEEPDPLQTISFALEAAADLASIDAAAKLQVRRAIGAAAGVDASTVRVSFSAAVMLVAIRVPAGEAPQVLSTLTARLATTSDATAVLASVSAGSLAVVSIPSAPRIDPKLPPPSEDSTTAIVAGVVGGVGGVAVLALLVRVHQLRRRRCGLPATEVNIALPAAAAGNKMEVQSTIADQGDSKASLPYV